jgi:hypothetical protein
VQQPSVQQPRPGAGSGSQLRAWVPWGAACRPLRSTSSGSWCNRPGPLASLPLCDPPAAACWTQAAQLAGAAQPAWLLNSARWRPPAQYMGPWCHLPKARAMSLCMGWQRCTLMVAGGPAPQQQELGAWCQEGAGSVIQQLRGYHPGQHHLWLPSASASSSRCVCWPGRAGSWLPLGQVWCALHTVQVHTGLQAPSRRSRLQQHPHRRSAAQQQ